MSVCSHQINTLTWKDPKMGLEDSLIGYSPNEEDGTQLSLGVKLFMEQGTH